MIKKGISIIISKQIGLVSRLSIVEYCAIVTYFLNLRRNGLTHSRRYFQCIHVSVDGTFFKCLLLMTSYNTSYLGLRSVASK